MGRNKSYIFLNKFFFVLIVLLLLAGKANATHNRAGEIYFKQTGPLTIYATLVTYTKTSSLAADRDSIEIFWGDGSSQIIHRDNGWGDPQANDVKINYYSASHTYPARASYSISMYDPNRVGGILNVNYPDSESVPFYLETTFTFLNTQFQGENNSVVLLQAPIDFGCVGEVFTHNPNAYDVDGDSLHYSLIIPLQGENSIVPDYEFPDNIQSGSNNKLSINEKTGNIRWDSPQLAGEYNIAIQVREFRQGILINSMIRDMQIFILDNCQNSPPEVEVDEEICVFAGDKVSVSILVDDLNINQKVRLEASGAPFISTKNLAQLNNGNTFKPIQYTADFVWTTSCEDISEQYYQIIFKAMDNGFSDTSGLATLKILKIKVTGPPPEALMAEIVDDHHLLTWNYPYFCAFADKDFFRGFSVWRSKQSISFQQDSCQSGLDGLGYTKIAFLTNENNGIYYHFEDFNVVSGDTYCYRVLPEFAHISFDGFPYNQTEGQASNEACISIPISLPYLTKNSVLSTDLSIGELKIDWLMPEQADFDSIAFPPPYTLKVFRSDDAIFYEEQDQINLSFNSYHSLKKGSFTEEQLNTQEKQFYYFLDLYNSTSSLKIGSSLPASSLFLDLDAKDASINLKIEVNVPWVNFKYEIFRSNSQNSFEKIAETKFTNWTDSNVENDSEYCYFVRSFGSYLFNDLDTLINDSQVHCTIPIDNEAPCTPFLVVSNGCDTAGVNTIEEKLTNLVEWSFLEQTCYELEDFAFYRIYYAVDSLADLELIAEIEDINELSFEHTSNIGLKGCYAISTVDLTLNESPLSKMICVANCPSYELPNVFTPNNDGDHDKFRPRFKRHIYLVDMRIYNQWGQLVYETKDPDINWDGKNLEGKDLPESVYHYICQINSGENEASTEMISGFIHLIRGR